MNSASEARADIRSGRWRGPTSGLAPGQVQANLVALPLKYAFDFLLFATRNPQPCPVIDVIEPGSTESKIAPGSDVRTDAPAYRLFRNGDLSEVAPSAEAWWREDLVTFLLGCSFTFDELLGRAGLPVRHVEEGRNIPMYVSNRACVPAGRFSGPLVVNMRPMTPMDAELATELTRELPQVHGAPVHLGDPGEIGIGDLAFPDFGDPVELREGEVPVFWACGVTTQMAIVHAAPDLAITHDPGHMFITDLQITAISGSGPSSTPGNPTGSQSPGFPQPS